MKAYLLEIKDEDDKGQEIVYADTAQAARKLVYSTELDPDNFIDVRARRYPMLDDMEDAEPAERALKQWRDGWYWWDKATPVPETTSDETFRAWYERNINVKKEAVKWT